MKAFNIIWDVDDERDLQFLPTEIDIPDGMEDDDEISDYISEVTGFCHNGRYYLRDVSNREPFAKWYICGKRRVFEDGNEPRANLIFQCGEQQEKVIYDDWNGVAAYSDTFNPNFYKEA